MSINQTSIYTCGPTSLSMTMQFYGYAISPTDICTYLNSCNDPNGVSESQLVSAAHHFGFPEASVQIGGHLLSNAFGHNHSAVVHIEVVANEYPVIYGGGPAYHSFTGGHYIESHGLGCDASHNVLFIYNNDPSSIGYKDIEYTKESYDEAWAVKDNHFIVLYDIPS
ncbi:hypothetical protein Pelo_2654 [Pelomyxa schiedti]|nr:hypothetical protein Pelo_2654 [Pelomyxa schiedti]